MAAVMQALNKQTAIVGLGKTGLSAARFLGARGVAFAVTDSRAEPPGLAQFKQEFPGAALTLGGFDAQALQHAAQIILSPGVSLREPALAQARAHGVEIIGDIELFAQHARAPVIAITGANGKSTVTALLGEMARRAGRDARVGGNLGTPALDLLQAADDVQGRISIAGGRTPGAAPDLYVLELSSFQLETTYSLNAAAATVLNITPDHMDRYRDLAEYTAAKQRVYRGTGVMVLNRDDPLVVAMMEPGRRCVGFTLHAPQEGDFGVRNVQGETWLAHGKENFLRTGALRIKGGHNIANALAALALGQAAGLPMQAMLETLKDFKGLPHRSQWVAEQGGVAWYNDSKGTNVGATQAALSGLGATLGAGKIVLIAGGDGKNADFSILREAVRNYVRAVVLIGRDAPIIARALQNAAPMISAADMQDAVQKAHAAAQSGDAVLLSPACASFDMYSGYEERGRVFSAAVLELLKGNRT
ncbi:MAG: UDP-N-acetylmuramoyl-L-alanine--D-glutamate ligase [Gammaproteobacteria bacterium]|nr:UDP-N-acetylmuramoyl-L-alanine--D-glutamate ligase [Gammaproteobacteria bacterium]